jgi:phospholipid/cholesterol/gamma-HCH transport system substrate-binding protein
VRRAHGHPNYLAIGAVAIIASLLFVYLAFTKRVPFFHGYRVEATFQSSNQLRNGSPARVAGVDIGKVVKIERGPGTTSNVTLELKEEGKPIHKDATLRIRPRLFLEGGFFVEVRPGTSTAPELEDGDRIPLSQTAIPVQFHQILSEGFNRPTRDSLKGVIEELRVALSDGGAEAFGQAQKPLGEATKDLAIISRAARGVEPHDVSDFIRNTGRVTAALARDDEALAGLVTNLNRTMGALSAQSGALAATIRQLDGTLIEAPPALTAIDGTLRPLETVAAAIRPSLRIAPPILRRTAGTLDQLAALTSKNELPRLVSRLKPTLDVAPGLLRDITKFFPFLKPVTDCVTSQVVPTLTSVVQDGPHTSNRPVWKELGSTFTALASASQNFDANGPWVRYLFALGANTISFGDLGGGDRLVSAGGSEVIGTNPRWFGNDYKLPFRPDQKCVDQGKPDLQARTGGRAQSARVTSAPRSRVKPLSLKQFKALLGDRAKLRKALQPRKGR